MQEDFAENGAVQGEPVVIWHGVWYPVGILGVAGSGIQRKVAVKGDGKGGCVVGGWQRDTEKSGRKLLQRPVLWRILHHLLHHFYGNWCGIMEIRVIFEQDREEKQDKNDVI